MIFAIRDKKKTDFQKLLGGNHILNIEVKRVSADCQILVPNHPVNSFDSLHVHFIDLEDADGSLTWVIS